jgi:hypothetical protein
MEAQISSKRLTGLFLSKGRAQTVQVFGHASRGIPGIEIVGLGTQSKLMKEKFVFLFKQMQIKTPLKRFVLCVEKEILLNKDANDLTWLELPLFVLLSSLAETIPITRLDDCYCSGRLSLEGEVEVPDQILIKDYFDKKWIGGNARYVMPVEELFSDRIREIKGVRYE